MVYSKSVNTTLRPYNPDRSPLWNYGGAKWRLSRSKIDLFFECQRCFYLDNKLGTKRPSIPAFTLNVAVDELLKKEFDTHRKAKTRHPIMEQYAIEAVPFAHAELDTWRDNFTGLTHFHEPTGMTISGAIDDVWQMQNGALIVVDYKATSKEGSITDLSHSSWEAQYKRQIGVYQWLFAQNGFAVHDVGYFVYANGLKNKKSFDNTLHFETTLVSCTEPWDWVDSTLHEIKACLERDNIPQKGAQCEYCPYREAAGKKLQAIHKKLHT